MATGQIMVGKRTYNGHGFTQTLTPPGFVTIVVMVRTDYDKYELGTLSPYNLKVGEVIFENYWQFSKVYREVPAVREPYSRSSPKIVWEYPAQKHVSDADEILPEYWEWRHKGFAGKDPIRYPVGFRARSSCLFSLSESGERLDYIAALKQIYLKEYSKAVKLHIDFASLRNWLAHGVNICIVEVDGPHVELMKYYKERYGVAHDFITGYGMIATLENLRIMLNDPVKPFGHGYCLAAALLDLDSDLI